ncbi:cysteine hydrolase family protein [Vibrio sonorensis]|uniref:cysteine hydrolase family protein n=1 Tax=Vibrio sonorensis TaxID=1004316 RepID=UPI0008DAD451|nr:cysteine hydrolase family protein [Vibrio sonorensis]
MSKTALVVIDLQNDYFPQGKYPLWNTDNTLNQVLKMIALANEKGMPVIHVQHVADPALGLAPFFVKGTDGVEIHSKIVDAAPQGEVVEKTRADSFEGTKLKEVLEKHAVEELLLCGMMTQNCVTHTALSKSAQEYKVSVVMDACTTVDEMIHKIALNAISTKVELVTVDGLVNA